MATKKKKPAPKAEEETGLSLDRLQEIWESPYGGTKRPDFSQLYPHYHPNCRFQDSIQVFHGKEKFMEMCDRLGDRCSEVYMDVHAVAQNGNTFFVEWTMTMRFKKAPLTPLYGATKITVDEDGLITEHRDYYDLWGDSLDAIPGIGKAYRWFMRTTMG